MVAGDRLKILGAALDGLLHLRSHCFTLFQRVLTQTARLRILTVGDWGAEERQFRIVANGYIRGALGHTAAAWLLATPSSHQLLLDRALRAAAGVVTGCPVSTPAHALMAEASLAPMAERCMTLAARLQAKA